MRAVFVEVPEHLIAERHRLGLDKADEMWEGELHVVPPGKDEHYRLEIELGVILVPLARAAGLHVRIEGGLFDPDVPEYTSYRVPDLSVFAEEARSERGVEGRAELVVEIRSPGDESLAKLPFYGRVGVKEVVIVDRDSKAVRRWIATDKGFLETEGDADGWFSLDALPVALRGGGGLLEVRAEGSITDI